MTNSSPSRFGRWLKSLLDRMKAFSERHIVLKLTYKILVVGLGIVIILAGIAMLVLPGPGLLTILFGLAILGTEFHWARKIMSRLRIWWQAFFGRVKEIWRRYKQK